MRLECGCSVRIRVQEFAGKIDSLRDLRDAEFHLIGHLQSNKAGKAVELFAAVDSVDSLRLAQKLNASAEQSGKKISALIEINVGGETGEKWCRSRLSRTRKTLSGAQALPHLKFRGLMTVPPFGDDPQQVRPIFVNCANCAIRLPRKNCQPSMYLRFPWECRTILKSQSKKVRPACAWELQSSE